MTEDILSTLLQADRQSVKPLAHIKPVGGKAVFATHWCGSFDYVEAQVPQGVSTLVLHLSGEVVSGRYNRYGGDTVNPGQDSLTLHPEGHGVYWKSRGVVDFMHVYLPQADMEMQAHHMFGNSAVVDNLSLTTGHDAPLRHCLQSLRKAAQAGAMGELELQGWIHMLIGQVLRTFGQGQTPPRDAKALEAAMVSKVQALVEDRIDEKIALDDMAALTGWDVYRFSRAFRNAVGQTPHQYVMSRRLERAKKDLIQTKLPLAEIAYASGFSSQQHMTNLFSKHLGVSPAKYRTKVCE